MPISTDVNFLSLVSSLDSLHVNKEFLMNWDCLLKDLDKGLHCKAHLLKEIFLRYIELVCRDGDHTHSSRRMAE